MITRLISSNTYDDHIAESIVGSENKEQETFRSGTQVFSGNGPLCTYKYPTDDAIRIPTSTRRSRLRKN